MPDYKPGINKDYRKMKTKECPSCAMEVDVKSKSCPICEYEFTSNSWRVRLVSLLLICILILYMILR